MIRLVTVAEAEKILGITRRALLRLVDDGFFSAFRREPPKEAAHIESGADSVTFYLDRAAVDRLAVQRARARQLLAQRPMIRPGELARLCGVRSYRLAAALAGRAPLPIDAPPVTP